MIRFLKTNYKTRDETVKVSDEALRRIAAVGSIVLVKGGTLIAEPKD